MKKALLFFLLCSVAIQAEMITIDDSELIMLDQELTQLEKEFEDYVKATDLQIQKEQKRNKQLLLLCSIIATVCIVETTILVIK